MKSGHLNDEVVLFGEVLADVFPDQSVLGGAPFNVARHLQAFDLRPVLISRTGSDTLRNMLLHEMTRLGMDTTGIQCDADYPTGQVRVVIESGSHRFDILPDQAYDHICPEVTCETLDSTRPRLAYFGTLAQRENRSREAVECFLEHCACPIFLDINLREPWYDAATIARSLAAADIVKLNADELAMVASLFSLEYSSPEGQAMALQQRFELKKLLVTCGALGSWLLDEQQQITRGAPVESGFPVIDTVGAGDAFAAVFMLGLLNQWDAPITLLRAGTYASAMCGVRGAAPPSGDFSAFFRQSWQLRP